MKIQITVLLFFITMVSCTDGFEYKQRLVNYLQEVHNISLNSETIVILISGNCGSCNERTIKLIDKLSKSSEYREIIKCIILPEHHSGMITSNQFNGIKLLTDEGYNIARYGIDFDKNLFIHYVNVRKIKYWNWLYMNEIYDVASRYGFSDI